MISIITITFNNFEDLVKTSQSLSVIPDNFSCEHIIINGGNCQKTQNFLLEYRPHYKFKIVSEPDKGIYDAFNKGIFHASGDYIQFLNSGDTLVSFSFLKKSIEELEKNLEVAFTHGDVNFIDKLVSTIPMQPTFRNIGRGMPYWHQTMITRKKIFQLTGLFDISYRYAADYDFVVKLLNNHKYGKYLPIIAVNMDGNGVSVNREWDSIKECFMILKKNHHLNPLTLITFFERTLFYSARTCMIKCGLTFLLGRIKRIKYRKNLF